MPIRARRNSLGDIASCGIKTIVKSALGNLCECRRRRRCSINNRPRVRTTGNCQRQCQYSKCKCFAHIFFLEIFTSNVCFHVPVRALSNSDTDLREVLQVDIKFRSMSPLHVVHLQRPSFGILTPSTITVFRIQTRPPFALGVIVAWEFSPDP